MGPRLDILRDHHRRRLDRQLTLLTRGVPFLARPMKVVLRPSMWVARVPLAILLIIGGFLGFLPILGFWMLPLGAMLLAVDFTPIRPTVAGTVVRGRRKVSLWRRAWNAWRSRRKSSTEPAQDGGSDQSASQPAPTSAKAGSAAPAKPPASDLDRAK